MNDGKKYEVRTDLALEARESFPGDGGEISGVSLREWHDQKSHVKLTEVKILDKKGAEAMKKPQGTYLTLEADQLAKEDEDYHREISEELSKHIRDLIGTMMRRRMGEGGGPSSDPSKIRILLAGLGNPQITPDALGPRVAGQLQVTRHLKLQYGDNFCRERHLPVLSAIIPGVMAQTGMETSEILTGVIRETRPDLLIVVDALAARSVRRLGTTIQLTDTGIHPGSGVGNYRNSLTEETLGIPVLAIGVPTVVGAAAIVHDAVDGMLRAMDEYGSMSEEQQYGLIRDLMEPEFISFYVTPPDVDEQVRRLSFTISEGIHMAVFP